MGLIVHCKVLVTVKPARHLGLPWTQLSHMASTSGALPFMGVPHWGQRPCALCLTWGEGATSAPCNSCRSAPGKAKWIAVSKNPIVNKTSPAACEADWTALCLLSKHAADDQTLKLHQQHAVRMAAFDAA